MAAQFPSCSFVPLVVKLGHYQIPTRYLSVNPRVLLWQEGEMKKLRTAAVLVMILAATSVWAQSDAQKVLDRFKSMVGTWEGKSSSGDTSTVTYKLMGGGTGVMAEMHMIEEDMTSMFYVDGDRLLMTHYCGAGNQPRMKASTSADGKTITFDFLDATNLSSPDAGHMHHLVIRLVDADHHTDAWTYTDHGKEMTEMFDLQRKK